MATQPPPFYERRRFQGAAALVALVAAIWAFIGAPTPWKVVADLTSHDLPASNTVLVFDASAGMASPFGKSGTRLDAAVRAVEIFTVPLENEGLALRTFGGSCKQRGTLVVDFGAEHGDDVRDATADQQPRGRSNLVNAVRAAIDDFAEGDFSQDDPRRVVIFTGTVDDCGAPTTAIRDDIKHSGVNVVFKLVGIKVKKKDRKRVLAFKRALGRTADIAFIAEPADIDAVGEWIAREVTENGECADGVDNDGDGRTDEDDPDCAVDDTEAPDTTTGDCSDGVDNDGDGRTDEDDPDCAVDDTEAPS
jgi:von Willebrand factor type A domain